MHITGFPGVPKLLKKRKILKIKKYIIIYLYLHIAVASPRRK